VVHAEPDGPGWLCLSFVVIVCGVAVVGDSVQGGATFACSGSTTADIAEGDGDLTHRIEVNGRNEIDEVGNWFNVFIGRIEEIVRRVAHTRRLWRGSPWNWLTRPARLLTRPQSSSSRPERITTAMNEMSSAVQEISQTNTERGRDAARRKRPRTRRPDCANHGADDWGPVDSESGDVVADRGTGQVERRHRPDRQCDQRNRRQNQSAGSECLHRSGQGRGTWPGIRCGGRRGRRLAERTSSATKEIDVTVHAIQEGTKVAVEAMRSSMSHVQSGVDSARSAGKALTSIIHGSESVQRW